MMLFSLSFILSILEVFTLLALNVNARQSSTLSSASRHKHSYHHHHHSHKAHSNSHHPHIPSPVRHHSHRKPHHHHRPTALKTIPIKSAASPRRTQTQTPSVDSNSSLESQALKAHNDLRKLHGANPLIWDDELAKVAQKWSDNCVFQHGGGVAISAGENLAAMSGTGNSISEAIALWTAEASSYNPNRPVFSHFTQMVWKATTRVGCSVSSCNLQQLGGISDFFVCEYLEAGNVEGEFGTQVQA